MVSVTTGLAKIFSATLLLISLFLFSHSANSQSKIITEKQHGLNKHKEENHNRLLGGMGFAFNYTSLGNASFLEFSLTNPATQTSLGTITGKSFYGADFNNFN